jgi:hypothetical protein
MLRFGFDLLKDMRTPLVFGALFVGMLCPAKAATVTWDGGGATTRWSEAANWSGDALPTLLDEVRFDGTSSKSSLLDSTFAIGALSMAGFSGQLTVMANFTVTGSSFIAGSVDFSFLHSGTSATLNHVSIAPGGRLTASLGHASTMTFMDGVTVNGGTWYLTGSGDVRFAPASLVDINHSSNVAFSGDSAGNELHLQSTSPFPFSQWLIDVDVAASFSANYLSLSGSGAVGTAAPLLAANSIDGPGNTGWLFATPTAPIPEPETYAMLIAGLVFLGFATRRTRRLQQTPA